MAQRFKRAVRGEIVLDALLGCTLERTDELMAKSGWQRVNPNTWSDMTRRYVPAMKRHPELIPVLCERPVSRVELKKLVAELDAKKAA